MIYGTPEFEELILDMIKVSPEGTEHGKRHDLYDKTVETAKQMRIHVYGDKPTELLCRVRPGEPEEIKKYREDNYEPTTKATTAHALNVVAKIANPSLHQIRWKDQTENGKNLQDYALQNYPKHNSVLKFLFEAGLKRMIADPNGVFTVRPMEKPKTQLDTLKPEIKVYGSSAVWWYDSDCFVIHIKEEQIKEGLLHHFEYYDRNTVIDFTARAVNQKTVVITEKLKYDHFAGDEIPVWFLTGETETEENGDAYYISFFEAALPFWNKAVSGESDLDAHFIMHQYPQKVIEGVECDFVFNDQRCQHGQIPDGAGNWSVCQSCKGSGTRIPVGPYGVHVKTREKLQEGIQQTDPVSYVTVPSDPTKLLSERVENLHKKGLAALNMDIIDKVGENQSGVAKVIDRGELYDFLYKISNVMFDIHLQNFFYWFNLYMFKVQDSNPGREVSKNLPEINKPVSFDLTTAAEKTLQYAEAKKATMNPEYLRQKSIEITSKDFGTSPDIQRRVITILELDPLPEMSSVDIEMNLASATISRKDAVIHINLSAFVDEALRSDDKFFKKTKQEKYDVISKLADKFIKDNEVQFTLMDDDTGGTGESDRKQVA